MSTIKNYSRISEHHTVWDSPAAFIAGAHNIPDGVHTVYVGKVAVEFLVHGQPFASDQHRIPVFFSGAVTQRETLEPPFFSGYGVARNAETPFIAVSDPLIDANDDVYIAWYTGAVGDYLQDSLTALFTGLTAEFGKELLFVGGSAGGFAALYYAARLGPKCSVFAWNPQTRIFDYLEMFVKRYVQHVGVQVDVERDGWQEQAAQQLAGKVDVVLPPSSHLTAPRQTLILQNRTDWHLKAHMLPWLDRVLWKEQETDELDAFAADENHMVAIVDYAQGHDPIPPMIISFLLADLLHTDRPVRDFLNGSDDV